MLLQTTKKGKSVEIVQGLDSQYGSCILFAECFYGSLILLGPRALQAKNHQQRNLYVYKSFLQWLPCWSFAGGCGSGGRSTNAISDLYWRAYIVSCGFL